MHMTEHMPPGLRSRVAGVKVHPQRRSAHSAALGGSLWEGHGIHGHHPLLPPPALPPASLLPFLLFPQGEPRQHLREASSHSTTRTSADQYVHGHVLLG